jgi:hypothetical protein
MSFYRRGLGSLPLLPVGIGPSAPYAPGPAATMTVPAPAPIVASFVPNLPFFPVRLTAFVPFVRPASLPPPPTLSPPLVPVSRGELPAPLRQPAFPSSVPTGQQEVIPGSTTPLSSGGGGYDYSRKAWDQQPELEEVPLPDGTVALVPKKSPLLVIAAGAGGGFLLGGPIGALVGAAAGYFVSRPKLSSAQIAYYRR